MKLDRAASLTFPGTAHPPEVREKSIEADDPVPRRPNIKMMPCIRGDSFSRRSERMDRGSG
jgi:hypothetical protein